MTRNAGGGRAEADLERAARAVEAALERVEALDFPGLADVEPVTRARERLDSAARRARPIDAGAEDHDEITAARLRAIDERIGAASMRLVGDALEETVRGGLGGTSRAGAVTASFDEIGPRGSGPRSIDEPGGMGHSTGGRSGKHDFL